MTPDHGTDSWQVGRVSLKRGEPYKIVITAKRSDAFLGYVAVDDFEFKYNAEDCTIMPDFAKPTTTTTTTTTPSTPMPDDVTDCTFEDNLCGWSIDEELNVTDRFHFERKNGNENGALYNPDSDHNGDKKGKWISIRICLFYLTSIFLAYFIWADALLGKKNEITAMSSQKINNIDEKFCFNFWFDVRVS